MRQTNPIRQRTGHRCQTYQQTIVLHPRQAHSRLIIDGTSVSTYGGLDDCAAHGHNRDAERLPREAMLELRRIKSVSYASGAVLISEVAKRQPETLKLLDVPDELFTTECTEYTEWVLPR
ncbi:MAG: hypothetical protein WCP35_00640 [Verrucomicrobiota bacterium]